jgi:tetratricopeptide (TPR) repeat protein
VQLAPLSVRAHSRRVQAIMDAGRFDDALAALAATAWGQALPTELRAQRARIEAARGDIQAACATMREVLEADPKYLDGWAALADWHLELRDYAGYLAAAEQLQRLAPNDPHALGYLAHANRMHGASVDTRPWLRRALQLKPDYAWAAGELFDLELEAGDLEAARSTLETLKTHSPSPTTLAREVELHARRRDKHAAMRRYRELLRTTGEERDAIGVAARALVTAGWRYDLLETLDIAVRDPATHPGAGAVWVDFSLEILGSSFMPPRAALENGALGRAAGEAYLQNLAKTRSKPRLRRFVRRMRGWLAADTETWGMVGYALLEAGFTDRARRWLADWRGREGIKPWMLLNAASALRNQGEDADAAAVSRQALELPADHAHACHELWLAADAALAGWLEEANERLARAQTQDADTYYQCLMLLVQAVVLLEEPTRGSAVDRYREALALVRRAVTLRKDIGHYPALRRMLGRTLWRAALTRARRPTVAAVRFVWLWMTTA